MLTANLVNMKGAIVRDIELPAYFGMAPNGQIVAEYVRMYLANQRLGTARVKTRRYVSGGGKKPYRQKGTGRARQGSTRAPHFVGGGRVFIPRRSFAYQLPSKKKQLALKSVLASRAQTKQFLVLDKFEVAQPKTKEVATFLKNLDIVGKNFLFVLAEHNPIALRCIRNLPNVSVAAWSNLNAYDVLKNEYVIIDKQIVDQLAESKG